jgi:anti-repressor protein
VKQVTGGADLQGVMLTVHEQSFLWEHNPMSITNSTNAGISCAVTVQNGQTVTNSMKVAEIFKKQHAHVLRAIQKIIRDYPENAIESNFGLNTYTDSIGRTLPMYQMNRDGFTLLAFSFTGKKAMQFKVAYINRFNEMERQLQGNGQHVQQSPADKLSLIVDALGSISHSLQTLALPCPCPEQIQYTPPTYYDVADFIRRNGLHRVNAQKFFTYYASRNWLVEGARVDWRNLCFSWNQNVIDWERSQVKI